MNKGDWIQAMFILVLCGIAILLIYAWINWDTLAATGLTFTILIALIVLFNKIRLL